MATSQPSEVPQPAPSEVTRLLVDWRSGNREALDRLMPLVYDELRRVARRHMNREGVSTLQATALVNEAYLRLVEVEIDWRDRVHFFAVAAGLMRRILVDRARRRRAQKRGGGNVVVLELDQLAADTGQPADDLLALDAALRSLEAHDPRKSKVLEMCYFGGLTADESAAVLEVSRATIERDLRGARAWVLRQMQSQSEG